MATLTIRAENMELSSSIRAYIEKRIQSLDKILSRFGDSALVEVEVRKTTMHHRSGEVYRAEIMVRGTGQRDFRAVKVATDIYSAIDEVKDEIFRVMVSYKDKSATLFKKGAMHIKGMMRGIGNSIPKFTKLTRFRKNK